MKFVELHLAVENDTVVLVNLDNVTYITATTLSDIYGNDVKASLIHFIGGDAPLMVREDWDAIEHLIWR
jgi:hypothetical protein